MHNDIPGKVIGILIAFVLTVIVPFVNTTVELEMLDRRAIVTDITNFMDEVVDSRQITPAMLTELNTSLASYSVNVNYEITRMKRSVNPDPLNSDSFYVSYIPVDTSDGHWDKGDRIVVHVTTQGYSGSQMIAHKLTGLFVNNLDVTYAARIR